jgi:predicted ABC-type ATPase
LKPSAGAVRAARLLLTQVDECLRRCETFALETTLSGKTYIRLFERARKLGYEIELHYLWLSSPAQAIARVRQRVKLGGHHVPAADIRRRFKRSLIHLPADYLPLASRWAVWDSRSLPVNRLAISTNHDIEFVRKLIGV